MDRQKCTSFKDTSMSMAPPNLLNKVHAKAYSEEQESAADHAVVKDVDVDLREVYFLIMHFLSAGPCQRSLGHFWNDLKEHQLLPRRYHAWFSRSGVLSGDENDNGISLPLTYDKLVERYRHVEKDHLVKLLRQLILGSASPLDGMVSRSVPNASDVPTLLGTGSFSLLDGGRNKPNAGDGNKPNEHVKHLPAHLRWPHMQADQVRGLGLREIGGGFPKHHRAPSIRFACYAIAKPSTMVQKMQNIKKLRGHRNAVYCAIFDRSGRYVITGSDDRLVKIWSMETAFCLASCRGHEGDITDLAVSSNNALVASASNDYSIRVWRLPDGLPISVLRGHIGAVTAIAFSPRPNSLYHLLSSSDDGTCRIWDARYSNCSPRIYVPKPTDTTAAKRETGKSNGPSTSNGPQCPQILCCAYNANGTVFVTGSSDTFARVWSAYRPNTDDSEQPNHEIDLLGGHENDVNYVQFSGSAVVSRSSTSDSFTEENIPKFRNSWFSHDNIVTCSRDGSAIIWTPKSRRSHGKVGRWTRAYHLRVPPPPMPPQPPRGGPRQRLLPTPRGVNMIVWSLDNRFVLAAIMDCRICVWNASDGSLVHSLTGHSESTYVLDVHPFNPRIAMSAGYDGKTIVWDIWEGTPIRIYEIGRFKLVDGKFSPDGLSIVLSDDVGQTYLLNTGQGESQKDAKYDQFFLGDYRPLVQDTDGNVLDQETQLVPYRRNILDSLCDSSMIPYPEPYQSIYQKRRLGSLGIEWRPSSIKFAIGPDIGLGQEYPILPLEDLDVVIEPMPEFIDAMYWEPENEVINDDTDSEYNVTEESLSEGEHEGLIESSSSDPECGSENDKFEKRDRDGLRRSKRKKNDAEVELMTSSGRRVRRRNLDKHDSTPSRSKRIKKSTQNKSKSKSSKMKSLRPQRVAARNALNSFSQISGTSADGEEEDGVDSEDVDSSESESQLQDLNAESSEQEEKYSKGKESYVDSEDIIKPPQFLEPQKNVEKKTRLVLKFSVRNLQKSVPSENTLSQADLVSSSRSTQETSRENLIDLRSDAQGSSSTKNIDEEPSENRNRTHSGDRGEHDDLKGDLDTLAENNKSKIMWGGVKLRTSKRMKSEDVTLTDACTEYDASFDVQNRNTIDAGDSLKPKIEYGDTFEYMHPARAKEFSPPGDAHGSSLCELSSLDNENLTEGDKDLAVGTNHSHEIQDNPPPKLTKLRIKSKKNLENPKGPLKVKFVSSLSARPGGDSDSMSKSPTYVDNGSVSLLPEENEDSGRPSPVQKLHYDSNTEADEAFYRNMKTDRARFNPNHDSRYDFPEMATDEIRRTRSMRLKTTSRDSSAVNHNFKMRVRRKSVGTSRSAEKSAKDEFDEHSSEEWVSTSKDTVRSRSARTKHKEGGYFNNNPSSSLGRKSSDDSIKPNWLMLSKQEGSRYIPQLGDEVVYVRQGHQQYLDSCPSSESGPWITTKGNIRAVEICSVKGLDYAALRGSGESCCKLTLEFVDPSSSIFGKRFKLTLPELTDISDFILERTRYDAAIERNWTTRDRCLVWWGDDGGGGGEYWEGRIVSLKDKSDEFPGSPWERYTVQYKTDTRLHLHCPWEFHDPASPYEQTGIDSKSRNRLIRYLVELEQSARENQDKHGIVKLNQIAQRSDFMNRFQVPLSPEVIKSRLENDYYRSLEALNHDIMVMQLNAQTYFEKNLDVARKMKHLSKWFDRTLSKL